MSSATSHLRSLFAIHDSPARLSIALKSAAAMSLPVALGTALGHQSFGLIANMGAFAVLYGTSSPLRFRVRLLAAVVAGLTASAALGALTAPWPLLNIVVLILMTAGGTFCCQALQIQLPGSFFFTLVCGGASNIAQHGVPITTIVPLIAGGALLASLVNMADLVIRPHGPEETAVASARKAVRRLSTLSVRDDSTEADKIRRKAMVSLHNAWTCFHDAGGMATAYGATMEVELATIHATYVAYHAGRAQVTTGMAGGYSETGLARRAQDKAAQEEFAELKEAHLGRPPALYLLRSTARWPSVELLTTVRTTLACALAAVVVVVFKLGHPYWAMAFAVIMLNRSGARSALTVRAIQRTLGTIAGLGLVWLMLPLSLNHGWSLVALIAVLQLVVELLVIRNYGLAVIFMTPLALFVLSASGRTPLAVSVHDRVLDTLVCSVCAIVALWAVGHTGTMAKMLRQQLLRDLEGMSMVLRDRAEGLKDAAAMARRQYFHYELLNTAGVLSLTRHDCPEQADDWRDVIVATRDTGMLLLGMLWHPATLGEGLYYEAARVYAREGIGAMATARPEQVLETVEKINNELVRVGDHV